MHSYLVVFEDIEANELKILIFTTVFEKLQIQRELFAFLRFNVTLVLRLSMRKVLSVIILNHSM